ncbi:putative quinol monooxygenase [Cupriavidus sp. 30B13]|uniref:putative quinol monooxygenase n=1 Tax=Cupriavidus sp. 30B13 TaxID=3384241 RepID=UPI003B912E8C
MEVTAIVTSVAKPGAEHNFEAAIRRVMDATRDDPGFIRYDVYRDIGHAGTFVFHEIWESEEHLAAHLRTTHVAEFQETAAALLERKEVRLLRHAFPA